MSKEKIFCLECNKQTKYVIDAFSSCHLKKEHGMTMKEYYDKHMKAEGEGECVVCGKPTVFENSIKGYRRTCSIKCNSKRPEFIEGLKESCRNRDYTKVKEKYNKTCREKFGTDGYSQTKEFKERYKETCLNKYGVEHNFLMEECKENREKALNKPETNKKRKKWWTDERKEKVGEVRKKTLWEKYNVDKIYDIDGVYDSIRKTNEKTGYWCPLENMTEFKQYFLLVWRETRKHQNKLYEDWDGKCYYTKKTLTNDFDGYHGKNKLQPTIDHKISIKHGFVNNILPEEIGHINNLCICSRSANCRKNQLTEEQYYEKYGKNK